MSTNKNKIKELIRKLIRKEIEEASFTANLDGGEGPPKTPYEFSKNKKKDDKKKVKHAEKVYGYTKAKRNPKIYKKFGA